MTFLSRILGLLRDIIFAALFGASGGTDAFFVAFKIPNFMRRLFAEGAFSQAFVPVFSEYKETRSHEALKDLVNHVAGTLGGTLLVISALGSIASPLLVMVFAPGFWFEAQSCAELSTSLDCTGNEVARYQLTADMLSITFPYIFFIALTAFAGGILNSFNRFWVPAFTPVLLNISLISAAVWGSPHFQQPIMALAWGVALAGLIQLLFQFPFLLKLGLMPWPMIKRGHEGVAKIIRLMIPAIVGSAVVQINLMFDTIIASFLVAGSVSWLYYSDRLVEFPLGVFGVALATVILPSLSRQHARQSMEQFNKTLDWALRLVLLIALPAALGLLLLSGPMLVTLFNYGEFDLQDTEMARLSLMAYSLGLPAFILIKVLAPGYYARQDTKTPVKIAVRAMIANMFLNVLFVVPMLYWGINGPHAGLALATTASAYMNAAMLYLGLRRQGIYQPLQQWLTLSLRITLANLLMAAFLLYYTPGLDIWNQWNLTDRLSYLVGFITIAACIYFITLFGSGFRTSHLRH